MEEGKVEEVLQFLMQLVEKDLQKEKLVDKLVERFERITSFRCIAQTLKAREDKDKEDEQQQQGGQNGGGGGTARRGRPPRNK